MERRLSDNAFGEHDEREEPREIGFLAGVESSGPFVNREWEPGSVSDSSKVNPARAGDFGPCLYFGPRGERCSRPALEGGFCARHRPGAQKTVGEADEESGFRPVLTPKRVGALIAAAAALWPFVAELMREILRHLR